MALATWRVIVGPSLMAFWYSSEQIFSVKPKKVEKAKVTQYGRIVISHMSLNLLDLDLFNYLPLSTVNYMSHLGQQPFNS